ncbi:MAG: thiamine-binding protein [Caldiserica bacterium]|nr:MAG: thiamine-binding protein [Caldisericota bacterium]
MPIMEISIIPLGTETPSVSKYVASALKILEKEEGIKFELTSMGTIIEADSLKRLLNIAYKMHQAVLGKGAMRIVTSIKIDDRKDKKISIKGKIRSVKNKLKRR